MIGTWTDIDTGFDVWDVRSAAATTTTYKKLKVGNGPERIETPWRHHLLCERGGGHDGMGICGDDEKMGSI